MSDPLDPISGAFDGLEALDVGPVPGLPHGTVVGLLRILAAQVRTQALGPEDTARLVELLAEKVHRDALEAVEHPQWFGEPWPPSSETPDAGQ